jgi:putative Ca2+/H+ antiporter (TMEM165/GDT1 family)
MPGMDIKLALTVFGVVFLAELGDKTQLATLLFSAKSPDSLITVFLGASLALVATSAIGVIAGGFVAQYVSPKLLSYVAGAGFVIIGIWTIWQAALSS